MTEEEHQNLDTVRRYLSALESGRTGDELAPFFAAQVVQVEYPNRLNPSGQASDLETILQRSIQGQKILSGQRYEVLNELARDNRVAVEASWAGTLAIPLGSLTAGSEMKAHFALFFELKDGLIIRQHNYDCFESW